MPSKKNLLIVISSFAYTILCTCGTPPAKLGPPLTEETRQKINSYWQNGEAEITRYKLSQGRYGDVHDGYGLLVFVTEPFRTDIQVKDDGQPTPPTTNVLKVNKVKKFTTGIYDYSLMTSVFQPLKIEHYPMLKASFSGQEWCGHAYSQLNWTQNNQYDFELHSYFEEEADAKLNIPDAFSEDSIFTLVRLDPARLPTGEFEIIPSLEFSRLKHKSPGRFKATGQIINKLDKNSIELSGIYAPDALMAYKISIPRVKRELKVVFEKNFPHRIAGWEEIQPNGFGYAKQGVTRAISTYKLRNKYWNLNQPDKEKLRLQLGLPQKVL